MKRSIVLLLIILLIPLNVYANIMCNDGTVSPSCSNCHRGCCSRHGGCNNNVYIPQGSVPAYDDSKANASATEQSDYNSNQNGTDSNYSARVIDGNNYDNNNYFNKEESSDNSWIYACIGILVLLGMCSSNTKKNGRRRRR